MDLYVKTKEGKGKRDHDRAFQEMLKNCILI